MKSWDRTDKFALDVSNRSQGWHCDLPGVKPVSLDRRGERWKEEPDKRSYRGGGKKEKKEEMHVQRVPREAHQSQLGHCDTLTLSHTGLPKSGFTKQAPEIIHHREKSLGSKTCAWEMAHGNWKSQFLVWVVWFWKKHSTSFCLWEVFAQKILEIWRISAALRYQCW